MSEQNEFVVYCIELLKDALEITGKEAYERLKGDGIDYIKRTYPALHTVSDKIIIDDLTILLS